MLASAHLPLRQALPSHEDALAPHLQQAGTQSACDSHACPGFFEPTSSRGDAGQLPSVCSPRTLRDVWDGARPQ